MKKITPLIFIFLFSLIVPSFAQDKSVDESITYLQSQWAKIKYQIPTKKDKIEEYRLLEESAQKFIDQYPDRPELKIWMAIILSTDAGVTNSLSSLGMLKKAKKLLLASIEDNPTALSGSAYTSLASLYYQAPSWPVSFGSKKKARYYFSKALKTNPLGIDTNYFYGDFLFQQKDYKKSREHLQKALAAKPRAGRKLADEGRRQEIRAALTKVSDKI